MDSQELKRKFPIGSQVRVCDKRPPTKPFIAWVEEMDAMCGNWFTVEEHIGTYVRLRDANGDPWSFDVDWIIDVRGKAKPIVLHPAPMPTLSLPQKPAAQINLAPKPAQQETKSEKEVGLATIFGAAAMAIFGLGAVQAAAKKVVAKKEAKEEVAK